MKRSEPSSSSGDAKRHRGEGYEGRERGSSHRERGDRESRRRDEVDSTSNRDRSDHRRRDEMHRRESSSSSHREYERGRRESQSDSHRSSSRDYRRESRDNSRNRRDESRGSSHRYDRRPSHEESQPSPGPSYESSNRGGGRAGGENGSFNPRPPFNENNSHNRGFGNGYIPPGPRTPPETNGYKNRSPHQPHVQHASSVETSQRTAEHVRTHPAPSPGHNERNTAPSPLQNTSARGSGRGAGRGGERGRGGGRGGRNTRRNFEEEYDLVVSRPRTTEGHAMTKQSNCQVSRPVLLQANFFRVAHRPNWAIYHYRVDFLPDETDTRIKKGLFKHHASNLPANIFDGSSLYTAERLNPDPMTLYSSTPQNPEVKVELNIRLVSELAPTDVMYLQLFNILVRKCLEAMNLEEMGRHFYDRHQAIRIDAHHLELWPGYKTSMRNHENDILLGVEITHKVLRLDSCLHVINNILNRGNDQNRVKLALVGSIVMTNYNRKTYRVDDIEWSTTPTMTFDMQGNQTTFIEYFQTRYNITIRDHHQPLLVSRPKKKDFHRGQAGPILLVPELCQMTGLTDEMRANNQLMRALATHLHTDPSSRVTKLREFMHRLQTVPSIVEELRRWGLQFEDRLVELKGHVIPSEKILFGRGTQETPNERYDWNSAFRNKPMYSTVDLKTWVIITPGSAAWCVDKMMNNMQRVSRPLNFNISHPVTLHRIGSDRPNDYAKAVDEVMNKHKNSVQLLFVILPKQATDTYAAVKKRATLEFGVPSQCFVARNAQNDKGLMSICTKLVVQMNAKLGGEPWTVQIPLKKLMIVGFDVYHCGKRKGASVGAMVATTSATYAKYFSTVSHHSSRDDLSDKIGTDFAKCLYAYKKMQDDNQLPDRIIMYRDGVGDGQLRYVYETELGTIRRNITEIYKSCGQSEPKFSFIVVTKKINTRMFALQENGRPVNPGPGTVADDVITYPERYDFYLVAQHSRQGTVSPVSYNVLYDRQGLNADRMQKLTFKLTHMYFNWSGTVTVPAPCQYAHKLAYLTGLALGGAAHERLANSLHFL